jgi:hypothetical protein
VAWRVIRRGIASSAARERAHQELHRGAVPYANGDVARRYGPAQRESQARNRAATPAGASPRIDADNPSLRGSGTDSPASVSTPDIGQTGAVQVADDPVAGRPGTDPDRGHSSTCIWSSAWKLAI